MATINPNAIPWGATGVPFQPANFIDNYTTVLPPTSNHSSQQYDNIIKGEVIHVSQTVSSYEVFGNTALDTLDNFRDKIKENLMKDMIQHMLKNNLIEFTSQEDMAEGKVIYRARAFLVPNDQVRILRTAGQIK